MPFFTDGESDFWFFMNGPPLPEAAFVSSSSIPTGIPFVRILVLVKTFIWQHKLSGLWRVSE
jgi:hypothetical protein